MQGAPPVLTVGFQRRAWDEAANLAGDIKLHLTSVDQLRLQTLTCTPHTRLGGGQCQVQVLGVVFLGYALQVAKSDCFAVFRRKLSQYAWQAMA